MLPKLKSLHLRLAMLAAALFVALPFVVHSDNENVPTPTTTATSTLTIPPAPNAMPAPSPGTIVPATGGSAEPATPTTSPANVPTPSPSATNSPTATPPTPEAAPNTTPVAVAPITLPEIKPIDVHYDRDEEIGHIVGELLENNHYLQTPITPEMSQRWLKNYFLTLDPTHLFFLQSDIDEFTTKYGNTLGQEIIHGEDNKEVMAPAFEIFNRYLQRVNENVRFAEQLLHDKYDFTTNDTYKVRTQKSAWFKDEAESQATWRLQVKSDLLNGLLDKKPTDKTIDMLQRRYVSWLRDGVEEDDMDVLEIWLSALTHAYDPHSDYFSPEEMQNFNIQAIKHTVTGIGAVLKSVDGYATIDEVITGGPADLDKRLKAGDKILAVGQANAEPVDAVNMKLNHVVDMIRGRKGTLVHLVVSPAGSTAGTTKEDILLKRDEVSIKDSLAKAHVIEHKLPNGQMAKFGVIDLHDFYDNTARDVSILLKGLEKQNVAGIILDFRNNGGGLLDQAVDLTSLFIDRKEPVVQIRRYDGYIDQLSPDDVQPVYNGPLLVMVNKMSASATEIVAAALQDYGRAVIVGDQSTHGKGTVQTLIPLDNQMPIGFPTDPGPGGMKMTVQKFYRVAGGSTQQKGVTPDIVLPSVLDALELGETTLPYYLTYDTVPPATYTTFDLVSPYLAQLKANSQARVAASKDFGYVRQDITYYKKKVDDGTVSLNEAARLKEQTDLKAENEARKKDLAARKSTRDTELDLTLDMVAANQAPAPPDLKKPKTADDDSDGDSEDADLDNAISNATDDPQLDEAVNVMADYTHLLQDANSKLVQTTPATSTAKAQP
jgi:carboxyl-terminal processing protease